MTAKKTLGLVAVTAAAVAVAAAMMGACGSAARLPVSAGMGPNPALPPPDKSLIPLVKVVKAKGWPADGKPVAAEGTTVTAFARGLDHPRWLHVLPNGDVLVAETNAPPRPEDAKGIKGWFFKRYQKKAGGAVPSANRITLLRDADGDGVAEVRTVLLSQTQLSLRDGAGRQRPVRGGHRRRAGLPLCGGPDADRGERHPDRRACPPAPSTTTGPRA